MRSSPAAGRARETDLIADEEAGRSPLFDNGLMDIRCYDNVMCFRCRRRISLLTITIRVATAAATGVTIWGVVSDPRALTFVERDAHGAPGERTCSVITPSSRW